MQTPHNILPLILAGGEGRRLRPLSRHDRPKPFIAPPGKPSLLQMTALRARAFQAPAIVCNARHRELVLGHLNECNVPACQIFMEPEARGTAAAIAVAAHYFAKTDPLLLVMPSDHAIKHPDRLEEAVRAAAPLARQGRLVIFGAAPRRAAGQLGYVLPAQENEVAGFIEKPGRKGAAKLRRQGWIWNSGICLFSAGDYLLALKRLNSSLYDASYFALTRATRLQNAIFLDQHAFQACPALSVDHAVLEKAENRAVVPVDMGWRDIGNWPSLIGHMLTGGL